MKIRAFHGWRHGKQWTRPFRQDQSVLGARGLHLVGLFPAFEVAVEAKDLMDIGAGLPDAWYLLVFHPRDAAPATLEALLDAGWSTTEIVTLSQIIAFLSFQIRVAAGLRVLATA